MEYGTTFGWTAEPNRPAPVRLARSIALDIIERDLSVGTHLGSLPDVARRHGISVPTLRKAIIFLQEDGIVELREGRGGGLVVAAPPAETAVQAMYLFFSGSDIARDQVREARDLIDVALAERACRFLDKEILEEVERIFLLSRQEGADIERAIRLFDTAMLKAARQPVFALVSGVLGTLESGFEATADNDLKAQWDLRLECSRAIVAGNLADAIACRRMLRPFPETIDARKRSGRLGDRVAESVKALIARRHLRPGDELGTESELQDLFGVGQITLRDALRPLERSGAIKVAQGRKGGIFVGSAEPYAAIEMVSLYLSAIRLTFQEQIESREILESRAAWLAAERITPELAGQLRQASHDDLDAARSGAGDWEQKGAQVERLVARACGNPLIEFFTLALIEISMTQARRQGVSLALARPDLMREVSFHHSEIVREIVEGKPARAAFATRRYIRTLGEWAAPRAMNDRA
ncbi:MAG: GntR family transcriptional regulator [Novosphingobium sp.]|nr:GntR family transcriptional regulator [Novosphingobium sp.]